MHTHTGGGGRENRQWQRKWEVVLQLLKYLWLLHLLYRYNEELESTIVDCIFSWAEKHSCLDPLISIYSLDQFHTRGQLKLTYTTNYIDGHIGWVHITTRDLLIIINLLLIPSSLHIIWFPRTVTRSNIPLPKDYPLFWGETTDLT